MDKILVSLAGIIGIIFTAWYFFGKKEEVFEAPSTSSGQASVDILVKGGYSPSIIQVKEGKNTTLKFLRTDENSCLEEVILSEFKIKRFLPLNKTVFVEIRPDKIGTFDFSCGMGMFHGKLIVKK
jgi:plastocyanin domain-containing protein